LFFEFVENFVLNFNNFLDILRCFKEVPLVCEFQTSEFNVEFVKDGVYFHALINFLFEFFNLDSDFTDEFLGVGQLINVFWCRVDFCCNLCKLCRDFVGLIFCFLLDEFNFLFYNLLELPGIENSDVFAVYLEH